MMLVVTVQTSFAAAVNFSSLGISASDVIKSLEESDRVTNNIMREKGRTSKDLSEKQKKDLDKILLSIIATKESLRKNQWPNLQIDKQKSGNRVFIKSVLMDVPGFIAIERPNIIGVSPFLKKGVNNDVNITINDSLDGTSALAVLYSDDGDGIFDIKKDKAYLDYNGSRVFKEFDFDTKRDRNNVRYSSLIEKQPNIAFTLIFEEQLPGNKIRYKDFIDRKDFRYFVAIFKDNNGFPGEFIGSGDKNKSGERVVNLTKWVEDEMLYAILFQDNGDGVFDIKSDSVVKGEEKGFLVIAKFKVIKG